MRAQLSKLGGHPAQDEFSAFLCGKLTGPAAWHVLLHWLCCAECADSAQCLSEIAVPTLVPSPSGEVYDAAVSRAIEKARRQIELETEASERVTGALDDLRRGEEPSFDRRLSPRERIEIELARSWELRYTDAKAMLQRAQFALIDACFHLRPEDCGGDALFHDCLCRVHAEYANALRVNDRFVPAQANLGVAFGHLRRGTGDVGLKAHLYCIQGVLLGNQGYLPFAQLVLDRALKTGRRYGLIRLVAQVLSAKGRFFVESDESEAALPYLHEALELLESVPDPDLARATRFNLASAATECGKYHEAKKTLWGLAGEFEALGQPLNALRARWQEGKIYCGLEDYSRAAREFEAARQGFEDAKQFYDAALVSLELAIVLRASRRTREAKERIDEAEAIFQTLELEGSVLLSVQMFRDCFSQRDATAQTLFDYVATLRASLEDMERKQRRVVERALEEEAEWRGGR